MSDQRGEPETETIMDADRGSTTGMPWWVKVSLIVVIGLVLVFVILKLAGVDGGHGPGRHMGGAAQVPDYAVKIAVTADNFRFEPDEITVTTGDDVAIALTSVDGLHDFVVEELDGHVAARKGKTVTGGFRAERPGRYTFYCTEPRHREQGMEGTLVVTEAPAPSDESSGGHQPPSGMPNHGGQ